MQDFKTLDATFTDGTGFISTDLARLIPRRIYQGKGMQPEEGQGQGSDPHEVFLSLPACLKM